MWSFRFYIVKSLKMWMFRLFSFIKICIYFDTCNYKCEYLVIMKLVILNMDI